MRSLHSLPFAILTVLVLNIGCGGSASSPTAPGSSTQTPSVTAGPAPSPAPTPAAVLTPTCARGVDATAVGYCRSGSITGADARSGSDADARTYTIARTARRCSVGCIDHVIALVWRRAAAGCLHGVVDRRERHLRTDYRCACGGRCKVDLDQGHGT